MKSCEIWVCDQILALGGWATLSVSIITVFDHCYCMAFFLTRKLHSGSTLLTQFQISSRKAEGGGGGKNHVKNENMVSI